MTLAQFCTKPCLGIIPIVLYWHVAASLVQAQLGSAPIADHTSGILAVSTEDFLSSLGVNTHVDQGYNPEVYAAPIRYLGLRNIRDGQRHAGSLIMLHRETGIRVDLVAQDVENTLRAAITLAHAGSLMAIEGPNEPNNFKVTYKGQQGGGTGTWVPVAELQRDLYAAVHGDPDLRTYPVFHVSEAGAETDNTGLQFLTVPPGAQTLLSEGTRFADYANPHNYVSGVHGGYMDNQAWQAADPVLNGRWDGLYVEYGTTWRRHFKGYKDPDLVNLPRVTTETGWDAASPEQERVQGIVLVNTYLAQFKRGWRYTFIYELGEGEGGGGNQGLFHKDWSPKLAATYIHNMTSVLADRPGDVSPRRLDYAIVNQPATVHDLLLQKSDGTFDLVIWGEQVAGTTNISVTFRAPAASVAVYDVTAGTVPIQQLNGAGSVSLPVGDHALILEVR